MFENNDLKINISDFQKVFAVTAVMMQTILTFALSNTQDEKTAAFIGTFLCLGEIYRTPVYFCYCL